MMRRVQSQDAEARAKPEPGVPPLVPLQCGVEGTTQRQEQLQRHRHTEPRQSVPCTGSAELIGLPHGLGLLERADPQFVAMVQRPRLAFV